MTALVVVGTQWGDEGKGKVVDLLARRADLVVRFQGGSNAGHTVVIGHQQFVLHQIPSGILRPGVRCALGNGMVVDPWSLLEEMDSLRRQGVELEGRLFISERAQVVLPVHRWIDRRVGGRIGTTGRGIGPCYVDKAGRRGLRMVDLMEPEVLAERLQLIAQEGGFPEDLEVEEAVRDQRLVAERLRPFVADVSSLVNEELRAGGHVLFEGAQGALLDVDHGTYPFVTSSNTVAGAACTGCGVGPTRIDRVLGVAKAYTTRVGEGPFPTELHDEVGELLRRQGGEYGATTGRPRRCGWFDAVAVRYAARVNGLDGLVLTKLDVLDGLRSLRICVAYRHRGRIYHDFPASLQVLWECEPVYEELPGWPGSVRDARSFEELPPEARRYVERIEELVGLRVWIISLGDRREEALVRVDPFGEGGRRCR